MPIKTVSVNAKLGDPEFLDEVNAAMLAIAEASKNVLRVEMRYLAFSGSKTISHSLGTVPLFVWGMTDTGTGSGLGCSEAEKKTWTDKTVRFTLGPAQYVWIFAR